MSKTFQVTDPITGAIYKRTSENRTYTHAVVCTEIRDDRRIVAGWCGRLDLAMKLADTQRRMVAKSDWPRFNQVKGEHFYADVAIVEATEVVKADKAAKSTMGVADYAARQAAKKAAQ